MITYLARKEMGESVAQRSGTARFEERRWVIFNLGRLMIISLFTKFLNADEGESADIITSSSIEHKLS